MSRSYKLPILKDGGGYKQLYRIIKRRIRQYLKEAIKRLDDPTFDIVIPKEKEIINDYNVCDYRYDLLHHDVSKWIEPNIKKYSRK